MQELRQGVLAHQGITLALEQDDGGRIRATIMKSENNTLNSLFSGRSSVAEALAKAEALSLANGCAGHYDIMEPDEWAAVAPADLTGASAELNRQANALLPRSGVRWGFSGPPLSPRELADIDPVRGQITRLNKLRDALFRVR